MESWQKQFLTFLKDDFDRRRSANPRFSLRAFARKLQVAPGSLTEAFSEKRQWNFSKERARELLRLLHLPAEQKNAILVLMGFNAEHDLSKIDSSAFAYLKNPRNIAILAASFLPKNLRSVESLSRRFGLQNEALTELISNLTEAKLLSVDNEGFISPPATFLDSSGEPPTEALRDHHRSMIDLGRKSIAEIPADEREITSLSFVGNRAKMDRLKSAIRDLENNASSHAYSEDGSDTIYQLCIQLYPLDHRVLDA